MSSEKPFTCKSCGWAGVPAFELTKAGALAATCPNPECGLTDPTLTRADFQGGAAAPVPVQARKPAPVIPLTPARPAAPVPEPDADVFSILRARRDALATEVLRLRDAEAELRQIERALSAIERPSRKRGRNPTSRSS